MPVRESVTRSDYAAGYLSTMAATITAAADALAPTPAAGLTSTEVGARRAKGLGNKAAAKTGRSYWQILRENVFQFTNNIMFVLAIGLVLVGRPIDALLSVGVVMTNVIVGVLQEIRAKRTLDRISLLTRAMANVVRDDKVAVVAPEELVVGDLVEIGSGDQIVLDGKLGDRPTAGRRVAADRRVRPDHQAARRRGLLGQLLRDRQGSLRRGARRQRQPGQQDHPGRQGLPPRPDATPARREHRHSSGPVDRRVHGTAAARHLDRACRAGRRRRRPGGGAGRPHPERPVRVDRHRLRAGSGPAGPLRCARPAVQRRRVAQPRRRAVHRQDRHPDGQQSAPARARCR